MKPVKKVLAVCGFMAASLPAVAQYDGGATQMLGQGMGFSNMSSSTLRNAYESTKRNGRSEGKRSSRETKASDRGPVDAGSKHGVGRKSESTAGKRANARSNEPVLRTQADVDKYMNERMAYHARALAPEYKRRAARDGTAAADKWIKARANELGKMEGERARKLVQRD